MVPVIYYFDISYPYFTSKDEPAYFFLDWLDYVLKVAIVIEQIDSRTQFWNWSENALLQGLYNNKFYNGDPVVDKLIIDKQSILVGGARLRQLRITPGE